MIKNIVFDLGNVILKDVPAIVLENIELTVEEKNKIKELFFDNWNELDLGNETLEEHFNNCKFDFSINEDIKERLLNYYKYRPFNKDMINLMNKLKNNNYDIFILSNNNKEAYKYIRKLPQFQCVSGWIISCDYCIAKPNREIYIKLFDQFNIKPDECFFIDDKKANVEVGTTFGMRGFILDYKNNNINELIVNMKENNISV